MAKDIEILEDALKKAKRNVQPLPPEPPEPADLPEQRHDHAVVPTPDTTTPNLVPGGVPMKP